jgi:hypothetical protein
MSLNIPMKKMLLPEATLAEAKPLLGFDYGEHMYHIFAFDFGDDGGAIGILREGDNFCARISFDALAIFNQQARAAHIEGAG